MLLLLISTPSMLETIGFAYEKLDYALTTLFWIAKLDSKVLWGKLETSLLLDQFYRHCPKILKYS